MRTTLRSRSFCRYCGALTTYLDSCCAAHRELLESEHLAPDAGYLIDSPHETTFRSPRSEATHPTEGTEA